MNAVVLLNADYMPLGLISWQKAVKLMCKGKVEVIKATSHIVHNFEKTKELIIPLVIRLLKFVRSLWKTRVPYNKRNVLIRDNFTCAYCGKKFKNTLSIDHVIPKSKGGQSSFDNTVTCCVPCNNKKDDRSCKDSGMYLKYKPYTPTISQFLLLQIKNAGLSETLKELGLV